MKTGIDISSLWVSVWTKSTLGMKAIPIIEALTEINQDIVNGRDPQITIIAVMESLEHCLAYNREIKRMLKPQTIQGGD